MRVPRPALLSAHEFLRSRDGPRSRPRTGRRWITTFGATCEVGSAEWNLALTRPEPAIPHWVPTPVLFLALLLACQSPTDVPNPSHGGDPYAPGGYRNFGKGLADVGDLDGDGRDEFTVSDPEGSEPATVWVLSGADAHVVAVLWGPVCSPEFGREVARVPDIDGDDVDEIAVAIPPEEWSSCAPGLVVLYSGRTRALLRTIVAPLGVEHFGFDIAGLHDIDGDGYGDLLVMSADSSSERCGFVFSGTTGGLLFEIWRPEWLEAPHIAPIGDVDGDGRAELALTGTDTVARVPVAIVYSGRNGVLLEELRGTTTNTRLGVRALALGDIDHQGTQDLLLISNTLIEAISCEQQRVLFSMRTQEESYERFEAGVGFVGDLDADGLPDFVLADPEDGFTSGSVACRSGRTGAVLWQEPPWPSWRNVQLNYMGLELAIIGDFDRDGVRDFIWAAKNTMNGSPGLVFISSGKTGRALKVLARGPKLEILRLGPKE